MIKSKDMIVEVTGYKDQIAVDLLIMLHSFFVRDVLSKKEIEDILENAEKLKGNEEFVKEDLDVICEVIRKF